MTNKNLLTGSILILLLALTLTIFVLDGDGVKSRIVKDIPTQTSPVLDASTNATTTTAETPTGLEVSATETPDIVVEDSQAEKTEKEEKQASTYTGFALQLGTFSNVDNAEKFKSMVESLASFKNHSIIVEKTGTTNKVLAMDFDTYEEARASKTAIDKELKIKSVIVDLGK